MHFVGGRDPRNVLRNVPLVNRILREHDIDTIVSTGSAMALPFFALGRARGLDLHYIESAARSDGPSQDRRHDRPHPGREALHAVPGLGGRQVALPRRGVRLVRARDAPSSPARGSARSSCRSARSRTTASSASSERLLEILPPDADVLWQTGDTDVTGLGITGHHAIPERELTQAIREADVLVAHAGVGTALAALEVGKCPMLVPRRLAHGEHVDDHQIQIAGELSRRGLAVTVDADELTLDHLATAAATRVAALAVDPPFSLAGGTRAQTVRAVTMEELRVVVEP